MSLAAGTEPGILRRYASDQLLSLAKLVLENALQPIVEVGTGSILGQESLLRGQERMGFETPLGLLDAAEQTGDLLALEQMAASRAIAKFSSLPDHTATVLFLNLDGRLIPQAANLLDGLVLHMKASGIAPSSICFEFSERFDNTTAPGFSELVQKMRRLGFKMAIDDFGVGHGELKMLCDHSVDYLKVDRHLISAIDENPRKRHLLKNIVNIAHGFGTRVIAEGIETEAEFLACQALGVDFVQGWFIARPTILIKEVKDGFPHLKDLGSERRKNQSLDEILIRKQIEKLPAVVETESVESVFELFRRNPDRAFFPVVTTTGEPRGIIHERLLKEYIYQPFGRDLLKNKAYERSISHFVEMMPIVGLDSNTDTLMSLFAEMESASCLIVTEQMKYAGIVSAASLIKVITEKQLKSAQEQNPLTALPGNLAIHDFLRQAERDGDESRYLCYCDFDNFKPFNDAYGFHLGDDAITLFAALMRRYFFRQNHFIGHVGGDDFFIGVTGGSTDELMSTLNALLDDFRRGVLGFYSEEDRAAGGITGHDRNGQSAFFKLMRCSIGILELPKGLIIDDIGRISASIAGIKAKAKDSVEGLAIHSMDGREPPPSAEAVVSVH